jgi:3-dehydroshikimate dehydratase
MILPGLVSVTFRQLTPAEIVALVRRAGLKGIEWGGDIHVPHGDLTRAREVRGLTEAAGLAVAAYGSYYKAGHAETVGLAFPQVLDTALALGAPVIRVWAGPAGSAETNAATRKSVVADLQQISGLAAQAGVKIAVEFHGGTLNDTNEMAVRLLAEVGHANFYSYWQPSVQMDDTECLAGLGLIAPRLSHLHVFHWHPVRERRPLAEGAERWALFLQRAAAVPGDRYAMLEFVEKDSPENFLSDAATLKSWLARQV